MDSENAVQSSHIKTVRRVTRFVICIEYNLIYIGGAAWNGGKATGEAKLYNDMMADGDYSQVDEIYNDISTER